MLPIQQSPAPTSPPPLPEVDAPTVIIVDDDDAVVASLQFALETEGFPVKGYHSSEALLRESELPRVGCLVLDYHLKAPNGLDLLKRLRGRRVELPAILITSQPSPALRRRASEADVVIVEKPLLGDTLVQYVRRALSRSAGMRSPR